MTDAVLIAHVVAIAVLTGTIWTVQLVHYPMLASVDRERFAAAHAAHSAAITIVVAPPWVLEGATTLWLLVVTPQGVPRWLAVVGAFLAAVPVAVTVAASVPAHARLATGFDPDAHARLVTTNRWRTLAWSAHGVVAVAMLVLSRG